MQTESTGRYRSQLPQLQEQTFLTDGGLETDLIFNRGVDLPCFASFPLIRTEEGRVHLREYIMPYVRLAREYQYGFVLESFTWRANRDWAERLGISEPELSDVTLESIRFLEEIREQYDCEATPFVISGCVGPRGDGYDPGAAMTVEEACDYHSHQLSLLKDTAVDFVSGITMTNFQEALGLTEAARAVSLPVVVSFTVETDGRLPTGQPLREAVEAVDEHSGGYPAYYMINCAHPTHFQSVLNPEQEWVGRILGVRANASCKSHAELDECTELDCGNPHALGRELAELRRLLPNLRVLGGCCGTDIRHLQAIAQAWPGSSKPSLVAT
jgi:homocysteine S-methyltransferase